MNIWGIRLYIQIYITIDFPVIAPFYPVWYRFLPGQTDFCLCLLEAPFAIDIFHMAELRHLQPPPPQQTLSEWRLEDAVVV